MGRGGVGRGGHQHSSWSARTTEERSDRRERSVSCRGDEVGGIKNQSGLSTSNRETLEHLRSRSVKSLDLNAHMLQLSKAFSSALLRAAFLGSGLTAHTGTEKWER